MVDTCMIVYVQFNLQLSMFCYVGQVAPEIEDITLCGYLKDERRFVGK